MWPSDTFVDFDHSLNTAVMKLREALGDSADTPLYIETIPKRGYRFIAPVEVIGNGRVTDENTVRDPPASDIPVSDTAPPRKKRNLGFPVAVGVCLLLAVAGWFAYKKWRANVPAAPVQRALTRLTFDDGLQTGATWSPDGRYIAYASDRGGKFDIWIQQISGGDPIQITKGSAQNWQPDWSPDGKLYCLSFRRSWRRNIHHRRAGRSRSATKDHSIWLFSALVAWSPDSSRILIQSAIGHWKKVYVVGLDGGSPREVLTYLGDRLGVVSATWHPDGKRITAWTFDTREGGWPIASSAIPDFWTEPLTADRR